MLFSPGVSAGFLLLQSSPVNPRFFFYPLATQLKILSPVANKSIMFSVPDRTFASTPTSRTDHPAVTLLAVFFATAFSGTAKAHTAEQGFVLLLPTDAYIFSGVCVVVITILATVFSPVTLIKRLFTPVSLFSISLPEKVIRAFTHACSLLSLAVLGTLIIIGFTGTHDPLRNLLPLTIWTIWWIGIVCLHGVIGNFWQLINPWAGVTRFANGKVKWPAAFGSWTGVVLFLLFSVFALADTAPEDPTRLAAFTAGYWLFIFCGALLFGASVWFARVEFISMLMWRIAQLAPAAMHKGKVAIGFPGWRLVANSASDIQTGNSIQASHTVSGAVFTLALLATGSFDGLNETFWWLNQIGINPLEFPGRSAVVTETVGGLLLAVVALTLSFAICVKTGQWLANRNAENKVGFTRAFTELSVAILPIALVYHFAHFLTSFMVNFQYTMAAATDPLQNGRDLLGLGRFYVTTGFFNTESSVKRIWLTQASAVVIGHVVSLLLSHRIALKLWPAPRAAVLSQLPLAVFMVLYTLLGLWLLAAPRGA